MTFLVLFACSKEGQPDPEFSSRFNYPLDSGSSWLYVPINPDNSMPDTIDGMYFLEHSRITKDTLVFFSEYRLQKSSLYDPWLYPSGSLVEDGHLWHSLIRESERKIFYRSWPTSPERDNCNMIEHDNLLFDLNLKKGESASGFGHKNSLCDCGGYNIESTYVNRLSKFSNVYHTFSDVRIYRNTYVTPEKDTAFIETYWLANNIGAARIQIDCELGSITMDLSQWNIPE